MKIFNLVDDYVKILEGRSSMASYISKFPSLFEHYFSFWSDRELQFTNNLRTIRKGEQLLLDSISSTKDKFEKIGIELDTINIVLFVGQNITNGHAARFENQWWIWIPVETYASQIQVEAFLPHEIIHGLHYALQSDLYFNTKKEKNNICRQLIVEGVATFGVMQTMGIRKREALWADFLSLNEYAEWRRRYRNQEKKLLEYVIDNWNGDAKGFFLANDKKDILQFRAGYLMGLNFIEHIADSQTLNEILKIDKDVLELSLLKYIKKERDK